MQPYLRFWPAPLAVLLVAAMLHAQTPPGDDPPKAAAPARPSTKQELDRVEALKLYGLGVIHEKHNRLLDAVHCYEDAARLDPEATPPLAAVVPLYLALDRVEDALTACRRVLELDPADHETAYLYARQLRGLNRQKEALAVLARTAALPGLKEHPDAHAHVCYDLGLLYENVGDVDHAEAAFREAIDALDHPGALVDDGAVAKAEVDARAAEICEHLGRLCLKAGHADRAVTAFEQARKKDPDRAARLSYNLAEVYGSQGKHREALECLDDYLRTQPQGVEGYDLRITLQRKLGREADVVPDLEASSGRDPQNGALKLMLAREYRKARRTADAERAYNELIQDGPTPEMYRGLFDLYRDTPKTAAARILTLLDQAVAAAEQDDKVGKNAKPGDANAAARARAMLQVLRDDGDLVKALLAEARRRLGPRGNLAFQTRVLLAGLAARTKQLDAAEELYRSCLNQPGGPGDREAESYAGLLRVLFLAHKYEDVLTVAAQGLEKAEATNRVLFHSDLARAHLLLNHPKEAVAAAADAVKDAGEREMLGCRLLHAEALAQAEKYDEATAECRALLKEYNQAGDVRDIREALSLVYSEAHQYDKSEEQLTLILQADPNDATANNDLGYQWADRNKNLAEAEKMIRKALDLDRKQRNGGTSLGMDADHDNAAFVDSLGWVLFRRNKLAEARQEMERAAALPGGEDDPAVWDHLGDVYFRMNLKAKAGEAWKKSVEMYEVGRRRRADERLQEIKNKLRLLEH